MAESVRPTAARAAFMVAGGIAAGFLARNAIGAARSSEMVSMPQRLSVIAAATMAGMGYGALVRAHIQPQHYNLDAEDARPDSLGLDVAASVWMWTVMSLHGVVPLPLSTAAWKLPAAVAVGALPAAAIGCSSALLMHHVLREVDSDWTLSLPNGAATALAVWPFAARGVAVWIEVPALGGSTWPAHLRHAAVIGIGPFAGLVIGIGAWMTAKAARRTEWEERDVNRFEWACIGVATAVNLWCLRRGLGASAPPALGLAWLTAYTIVGEGMYIGDLLYTQWVNYQGRGAASRGSR